VPPELEIMMRLPVKSPEFLSVFIVVKAALLIDYMHSVCAEWLESRSLVVRASDSQCRGRNCPRFDPSILLHSGGIWGAVDEAVLISYIKR
jgi:hypothetical protein